MRRFRVLDEVDGSFQCGDANPCRGVAQAGGEASDDGGSWLGLEERYDAFRVDPEACLAESQLRGREDLGERSDETGPPGCKNDASSGSAPTPPRPNGKKLLLPPLLPPAFSTAATRSQITPRSFSLRPAALSSDCRRLACIVDLVASSRRSQTSRLRGELKSAFGRGRKRNRRRRMKAWARRASVGLLWPIWTRARTAEEVWF